MPSRRRELRLECLLVFGVVLLVCVVGNLIGNRNGWHSHNFEFGSEYNQIALSLLDGRGYADPFRPGTGPTGWMPPGYTLVLAAGHLALQPTDGEPQPERVVLFIVTLKCLFTALAAGLTVATMQGLQFSKAARLAVVPVWVLIGAWAGWEVLLRLNHDTWWIAGILAMGAHGIVSIPRSRHHVSLILALALAALSSPVMIMALLFCLAVRVVSLPARWRWSRGVKPVVGAVLAGVLCWGGWIGFVRANTGIWSLGKTNGGFELWQSLEHTPDGRLTLSGLTRHPALYPPMTDEYERVGEKAFLKTHNREALEALTAHPGRYARHVLNRAANAFAWLYLGKDAIWINTGAESEQLRAELAELENRGLVDSRRRPDGAWRFLYVRLNLAELQDFRPGLSTESRDLWLAARDIYQAELDRSAGRLSWHLRSFLLSGLVSLSWLTAWLACDRRGRRRLGLQIWLYAAILGPYVLVSHYHRYQQTLTFLQVLAVAALTGVMVNRIQRRRIPHP